MPSPQNPDYPQVLGPGAYIDEDGALHINAREVCIALGEEPTPAAQDEVEQIVRALIARDGPLDVEIEVRYHGQ